jgi:hypothetical protein
MCRNTTVYIQTIWIVITHTYIGYIMCNTFHVLVPVLYKNIKTESRSGNLLFQGKFHNEHKQISTKNLFPACNRLCNLTYKYIFICQMCIFSTKETSPIN